MSHNLTTEKARQFSRDTSAVVKRYIKAQNSVFKFSFLKALGLKATDAEPAAAAATELREQVHSMLEEVRELKLDANVPLEAFFMTMRPYLRALEAAMTFFIALCGSISAAQKEKNSAYWKEHYKNDLVEHQRLEQEYLKIGVELNKRWQALKDFLP